MQIQQNVPLAPYTSFKIGGPAAYFVVVRTPEQLCDAIGEANETGKQPFFLSGGTNLLVPDEGLDRFVIKLEITGMEFRPPPAGVETGAHTVKVFGGTVMQDLVNAAVKHAAGGLEWAGGLPGSVGGAIRGNAGAFGGEMKDVISSVETIDREGKSKTYTKSQCQFGYRDSIFKRNGEAVISAILTLHPDDPEKLTTLVEDHRSYRQSKHPLEYANAGSVFKNVPVEKVPKEFLDQWREKIKSDPFPVIPTAVINAAAGLKGYRVGDAQLSEKHTNYIVNLGAATAADIRQVITDVKRTVNDKFGITLEEEILIL